MDRFHLLILLGSASRQLGIGRFVQWLGASGGPDLLLDVRTVGCRLCGRSDPDVSFSSGLTVGMRCVRTSTLLRHFPLCRHAEIRRFGLKKAAAVFRNGKDNLRTGGFTGLRAVAAPARFRYLAGLFHRRKCFRAQGSWRLPGPVQLNIQACLVNSF